MMRPTTWGGTNLDWIEQLFGISPDAGTGTLEALIAGAVVAVILGVIFAVRARNSRVSERRH
jgi:hypothetical protein